MLLISATYMTFVVSTCKYLGVPIVANLGIPPSPIAADVLALVGLPTPNVPTTVVTIPL